MGDARTARSTLRAATADSHERVDRAFAGFDLGGRAGYAAFLQAQAAAFLPVERGVESARPEAVLHDWALRRRSGLLVEDLARLGVAAPVVHDAPAFGSVEAALGAIYVLEGSRLGGRLLSRSVPEDLPRGFLLSGEPLMWRELIAVVDATLVSEPQLGAAIEAARMVFTRFEASALQHREAAS